MGSIYRSGGSSGSIYRRSGGGYSGALAGGHGKHKSFLDELGVAGNLIRDVGSTAWGLPGGIELAVTHPVRAAKGIAKSYEQTYSPLFHGDIKSFLHGLEQHPLGPIMDALTLVTLGGSSLARTGEALGRLGVVDQGSALARLGERNVLEYRSPAAMAGETGAPVAKRETSTNPVIRARQTTVHNLLNRLNAEAPMVGEFARYTRAARRSADETKQAVLQEGNAYHAAFSKLSVPERKALALLQRVPLAEHLDAMRTRWEEAAAHGSVEAQQLLHQVGNPKVQKLYLSPSKAMLNAHAEAEKLAQRDAALKADKGVLTAHEAEQARYRHTRIAAGADVYTGEAARAAARRLGGQITQLRRAGIKVSKTASRLRAKGTPELTAARKQAYTAAVDSARKTGTSARASSSLERVDRLQAQLAQANDQLGRVFAGKGLSSQELLDHGLKSGSDVTAFRARLIDRLHNQATSLAAQYDRALQDSVRRAQIDERLPGRGELAAKRTAASEQLQQARTDIAQRLHAGRFELDRLAKLEDQLRAEQATIHPGIVGGPSVDELRQQIEAAGRPQPTYVPDVSMNPTDRASRGGGAFSYGSPVHHSEGVVWATGKLALQPDVLGPNFLRTVTFAHYRDLHDVLLNAAVKVPRGGKLERGWVWVKRPVGVPETPTLRQLMPDSGDLPSEFRNVDLTTADAADALIDHGARYAVPQKMASMLEDEFRRSQTAAARFLAKPTTVWRALVLNLRVGWLVNNVVGNHLLYALRYSGPSGLRGYLDAIAATKGADAARRLLDMPETKRSLTKSDIAELLPGQSAGTFLGSQAPAHTTVRLGKRSVDVAGGRAIKTAGLGLAKVDKAVEQTLRRSAVNAELRKSPEVRARMRAMPRETRSFREAARQELAANSLLAQRVSEQVNAALGDFLGLSPFEQRYLRNVFPFYAWYKAITKIAGRLPADAPGRVAIIARLSELGNAASAAQLGPLPSYLQGAVPIGNDRLLKTQGYNPLTTITQLAKAASVPLVPGANTNQLAGVMNPFVQGAGQMLFGRQQTKHGLAADMLASIAQDLPQSVLIQDLLKGHPKSSKVYRPSTLDDLLNYLGVPTKTINPYETAQAAREGR